MSKERQDSISACRSIKEFYVPMIRGYTGCQPPSVEVAFDNYMCHYLHFDDYSFVDMARSIGAAHGSEDYYVKKAEKIIEEVTKVKLCSLEDLPRIDCCPIVKGIAINRLKKSVIE